MSAQVVLEGKSKCKFTPEELPPLFVLSYKQTLHGMQFVSNMLVYL